MNFQQKLSATTADLRERAQACAISAIGNARVQADAATKRVEKLKGSMAVLNMAGREFKRVARRHAVRFVKQNSTLAAQVRDDVSALALSTFASLSKSVTANKPRKPATARKRARKTVARAN